MNFIQGVRLQLFSAGLMLIKYSLIILVSILIGALLSHITIFSTFLTSYGVDTYSFSILLLLISTAFANIMGKGSH